MKILQNKTNIIISLNLSGKFTAFSDKKAIFAQFP